MFDDQVNEIEFGLSMMALSLVRYVSDYARFLSISVVHHLVQQCDIFCLLIPILENKPWLRNNVQNKTELYQDSKWQLQEDSNKLAKCEA